MGSRIYSLRAWINVSRIIACAKYDFMKTSDRVDFRGHGAHSVFADISIKSIVDVKVAFSVIVRLQRYLIDDCS